MKTNKHQTLRLTQTKGRIHSQDLVQAFDYSNGRSGTRQSIGDTDFYNFSDGSSTTRSRIGNTDFYSGSKPSLSGSTNQIGDTTFGTWQDGTTSTHQSIGGSTLHNYNNRKSCTSNRVGSSTFTSCY